MLFHRHNHRVQHPHTHTKIPSSDWLTSVILDPLVQLLARLHHPPGWSRLSGTDSLQSWCLLCDIQYIIHTVPTSVPGVAYLSRVARFLISWRLRIWCSSTLDSDRISARIYADPRARSSFAWPHLLGPRPPIYCDSDECSDSGQVGSGEWLPASSCREPLRRISTYHLYLHPRLCERYPFQDMNPIA